MLLYDNTDINEVWPETYQSEDPSVPATSKTSYPSSSWKSMKTRAIVSPGSARIVHVQSALLPYSKGKWGLEIIPLCPLKVPPQASSAGNRECKLWDFAEMHKALCQKKRKKPKANLWKHQCFCSELGPLFACLEYYLYATLWIKESWLITSFPLPLFGYSGCFWDFEQQHWLEWHNSQMGWQKMAEVKEAAAYKPSMRSAEIGTDWKHQTQLWKLWILTEQCLSGSWRTRLCRRNLTLACWFAQHTLGSNTAFCRTAPLHSIFQGQGQHSSLL